MRKDRFFINQNLKKGTIEIFNKNITNQLKKVLKKRNEDEIILFNNSGSEAKAKIKELSKDKL